jgi:tripeptidyl-peptidase-1
LFLLVADSSSSLVERRYAVKEFHAAPSQFVREDDAPRDHVLQLQIGLKQSRFEEFERHIYESKLQVMEYTVS